MASVRRSDHAELDLLQIWVQVAEDSFDSADKLLRKLEAKARDLAEMPGMGRARDDLSPGLRSFPVGNYILLYQPIEGGIELVRVLHGARNLPGQFRLDE